jgi:molybdenum cofactor cytidylyltransferase
MTGLIILAAGESSRLGKPKQNLLFNGETLLQHAVETGQRSKVDKVIVVLGAHTHEIKPIPDTVTLYNKDWQEGMGSSIRCAMVEINNDPSTDKVIIMLCDQPFVSAYLLNKLISKQVETDKPIIACAYNGTSGVPVLFVRSLFSELMQLQGKEGAKKILKQHVDGIATVPFERGGIDIDTPEDYNELQKLSD